MAFVDLSDGTKIHYIKEGNGEQVIVFVHGNLGNHIWWEASIDRLPSRFTAYALDLPGSGHSPETGIRHTIKYLSEILAGFVDTIGLEKIFLVGHSMGGGVCQLYAMNNPNKVKKLLLVNSMSAEGFQKLWESGTERLRTFMSSYEQYLSAMNGIAAYCTEEQIFKRAITLGHKSSEQVYMEQPQTMYEANWFDRIEDLICPVLYLYGKEDQLLPMEQCVRTADAITDCHLVLIDNASHCPMVEVPDVVNNYLEDFFQ